MKVHAAMIPMRQAGIALAGGLGVGRFTCTPGLVLVMLVMTGVDEEVCAT